jgi:hypothetical protein
MPFTQKFGIESKAIVYTGRFVPCLSQYWDKGLRHQSGEDSTPHDNCGVRRVLAQGLADLSHDGSQGRHIELAVAAGRSADTHKHDVSANDALLGPGAGA